MEIEQISCRKRYEAIINVNISDLDGHYDYHGRLNYKQDVNICTDDENCYPLSITVEDDSLSDFPPSHNDSYVTKHFGIQVDWISEMKVEADLEITFLSSDCSVPSEKIRFQLDEFEMVEKIGQNSLSIKYPLLGEWNHLLEWNLQQEDTYQYYKIVAIKGKVTLKFMAGSGVILKERLIKSFSKLMDPMLS